ncbi:SipW-dependent-type signal peptide-containing protein [Natrinema sp. H-ect4]|uniref:SipW-dependent-type signal peptide-containing protein n=1 Tax=Natrinema sp. H-ect4 TaxID=3242699 RepID=UPI0035A899FB
MTKDKFDLSRRKVLGSLGVVGTGAVLGGAGTAALFNDQDDVTGNTMQAGQLDLEVDYTAENTGTNQVVERGGNEEDGTGDLTGFELSDIKPGDDGSLEVCLKPVSNPAWIWMSGNVTENAENNRTEPEVDVDDTPNQGELANYIEGELRYVANGDVIAEGTLAQIMGEIGNGVLIDHDPSTSEDDAFPANNRACVILDWWVDSDVGNIIQTDRAKFDLSFYAEQERHNSDSDNPFA